CPEAPVSRSTGRCSRSSGTRCPGASPAASRRTTSPRRSARRERSWSMRPRASKARRASRTSRRSRPSAAPRARHEKGGPGAGPPSNGLAVRSETVRQRQRRLVVDHVLLVIELADLGAEREVLVQRGLHADAVAHAVTPVADVVHRHAVARVAAANEQRRAVVQLVAETGADAPAPVGLDLGGRVLVVGRVHVDVRFDADEAALAERDVVAGERGRAEARYTETFGVARTLDVVERDAQTDVGAGEIFRHGG